MGTPARINFDGLELRVAKSGCPDGIAEKLYNTLNCVFEVSTNKDGIFKGYISIAKATMLNAFISANRFEIRFHDDIGYSYQYFIDSKSLTIKAVQEDKTIFYGDITDFILQYTALLHEPKLYYTDERMGCYCKQKELFNKNSYEKILDAHRRSAEYFEKGNPNKVVEHESAEIMQQLQNLFTKEVQSA